MLKYFVKWYANNRFTFYRLPKIRWISITYTIDPLLLKKDDNLVIRLATDKDIEYLENHPDSENNIIKSALQFWHNYGFRSLYLGFFDGDEEPAIFQYVIGEEYNNHYKEMDYGGMYLDHGPDSVQFENIYLFYRKRVKNAIPRFQQHLLSMLYERGIRTIRSHIHTENRTAIRRAGLMGFEPEKWIILVLFNIPVLRNIPKHFIHMPIMERDQQSYPVNLFKYGKNKGKMDTIMKRLSDK